LFVQNGGKVGGCGFQSVEEVGPLPNGFRYYRADVTDESAMRSAVDQFVSDHGVIDVLVANAGMNMPKTLIPDTVRGKQVVQVNVMGVIHSFSSALPHFLKQKAVTSWRSVLCPVSTDCWA
jgi:NADP-dependent 3-hydroxy acid dehydrogenase YdfG